MTKSEYTKSSLIDIQRIKLITSGTGLDNIDHGTCNDCDRTGKRGIK